MGGYQGSPYSESVISFEAVSDRVTQARADLLVVPCRSGPGSVTVPGPAATEAAAALGIDLAATLGARGFAAEIGDTFATLALGRLAASAVLFVGLGVREQAGPDDVRQAAMRAAGEMSKAARIAVALPDADQAVAAAFAEGLLLGAYQFDRYRRRPVAPGWRLPALEHVSVLAGGASMAAVGAGLRRGQALAGLTNWVRDLVNASPSETTPVDMANQAQELAETHGLACSVLTVPDLAAGGFGGILGVGQGSRNEPRLVELSYRGGGDAPVIGLTGKGITFDSGGLSLKRDAEIEWMKSDMAGAACIMAVLRGAAEFGLPVNIDAVLPFAENMPGGSAQRPGDVITHRGGTTSEVRDTDSEGRLIIADALAYLAERNPAMLVAVGRPGHGRAADQLAGRGRPRGGRPRLAPAAAQGLPSVPRVGGGRYPQYAGRRAGHHRDGRDVPAGIHRRPAVDAHRQRLDRVPGPPG